VQNPNNALHRLLFRWRYIATGEGAVIDNRRCILKIFFSHSSRDKAAVREIKSQMYDFLDIWLDEGELLPGENLEEEIVKSIQESDLFVLFISEYSINSEWVKREILEAEIKEKSLKRPYLLPVLLGECDMNGLPEITGKLYLKLSSQSRDDVRYFAQQLNEKIFHLTIRYGFSSREPLQKKTDIDESEKPINTAIALGGRMREMVHEQRDVYIDIINSNLEIKAGIILLMLDDEASVRLDEAIEREKEWARTRDEEDSTDMLKILGAMGSTMYDIQGKVARKIKSKLEFISSHKESIKDEEALYIVKKFISQL